MSAAVRIAKALTELGDGPHSDHTVARKARVSWRSVMRAQDDLRILGWSVKRSPGVLTSYNRQPQTSDKIVGSQPLASDRIVVTPDKSVSRVEDNTLFPSPLPAKGRERRSLRSPRATRAAHPIPEGWCPSADDRTYAIKNRVDPELASQEFYNYWWSEQKAKKDWSATFRNRVLMLVSQDRFRLPVTKVNGRRVSSNGFEEVRAGDGHSYLMEPPVWASADADEDQP